MSFLTQRQVKRDLHPLWIYLPCFASNSDGLVFLTYSAIQGKFLLHSRKQASRGIDGYVNSFETERVIFKENGAISKLNEKPRKLLDKLTCLDSNISSTEPDVKKRIEKPWTTLNTLSTVWKSNPSESMKQEFFRSM